MEANFHPKTPQEVQGGWGFRRELCNPAVFPVGYRWASPTKGEFQSSSQLLQH